MIRLTKALFGLSDALAWLLAALALAVAMLLPVVEWVHARMEAQTISFVQVVAGVVICLITAAGAYGVTRRKPLAIMAVAAPAIAWAATGQYAAAIFYAVFFIAIFGAPFFLAFLTACSNGVSGKAP